MTVDTTVVARRGYMNEAGELVDELVEVHARDTETGLTGAGVGATEAEAIQHAHVDLNAVTAEREEHAANTAEYQRQQARINQRIALLEQFARDHGYDPDTNNQGGRP